MSLPEQPKTFDSSALVKAKIPRDSPRVTRGASSIEWYVVNTVH